MTYSTHNWLTQALSVSCAALVLASANAASALETNPKKEAQLALQSCIDKEFDSRSGKKSRQLILSTCEVELNNFMKMLSYEQSQGFLKVIDKYIDHKLEAQKVAARVSES